MPVCNERLRVESNFESQPPTTNCTLESAAADVFSSPGRYIVGELGQLQTPPDKFVVFDSGFVPGKYERDRISIGHDYSRKQSDIMPLFPERFHDRHTLAFDRRWTTFSM